MYVNRRLYAGNFPYSTTEDTLKALFGTYGEVIFVKICWDGVGEGEGRTHNGYGFIEMETPEAAAEALAALRNTTWNGRMLRVGWAHPRPSKG